MSSHNAQSSPLISNVNFEQTTLQQVIEKAEDVCRQVFDFVHLSLDSGNELILLAAAGQNLDSIGMILKGLRDLHNSQMQEAD